MIGTPGPGRTSVDRPWLGLMAVLIMLMSLVAAPAGAVVSSEPEAAARLHRVYHLPLRQHPESVVYDPRHHTFYASGLARGGIVKVRANGETTSFADGKVFPHNSTVGLRIDPRRNVLWVCNSDAFAFFDAYTSGDPSRLPREAALLSFDLGTGTLLRTIPFTTVSGVDPTEPQLCNDVAIDHAGNVYATESVTGYVVRVDAATGAAAVLLKDRRLHAGFDTYPIGANGIQLTPDASWLYVNVMGPGRMLRMHPDGSSVQEVALSQPIHGDGFILTGRATAYIVDSTPVFTGLHTVKEVRFGGSEARPTGRVTRTVPWPKGVAFDTPTAGGYGEGRFWIADAAFNHLTDPNDGPGQFFGVDLP